jgi:hypothetical protein
MPGGRPAQSHIVSDKPLTERDHLRRRTWASCIGRAGQVDRTTRASRQERASGAGPNAGYPELAAAEYGELAPVGTGDTLGTGMDAVVDVSGYGVSRQVGKNAKEVVSYRSRLGGSTFIIATRNSYTAGYNLQLASNFGNGPVARASVTPAGRSSSAALTRSSR